MFKTASQNRQHAIDRRGQWAAWSSGDLAPQTARQEADAIRGRLKQIDTLLAACVDKEQRAALGQEKLAHQTRINELRKSGQLRQKCDIQKYIVDVVRARMTKGEWDAVVQAAERLRKEEEAKSEPAKAA